MEEPPRFSCAADPEICCGWLPEEEGVAVHKVFPWEPTGLGVAGETGRNTQRRPGVPGSVAETAPERMDIRL